MGGSEVALSGEECGWPDRTLRGAGCCISVTRLHDSGGDCGDWLKLHRVVLSVLWD